MRNALLLIFVSVACWCPDALAQDVSCPAGHTARWTQQNFPGGVTSGSTQGSGCANSIQAAEYPSLSALGSALSGCGDFVLSNQARVAFVSFGAPTGTGVPGRYSVDELFSYSMPGFQGESHGTAIGQCAPTQCSDGIDNDGDGLVDMSDPGCSSPDDDDETNQGPQCTANAGDLMELPEGIPAGQQSACSTSCVVTPFAGMKITAGNAAQTGVVMYGIVKEPPTSCSEDVEYDPRENHIHRCKTVEGQKLCVNSVDLEEAPGDSDVVPPVPASKVDLQEVKDNGCAKYSGSASVLCQSAASSAPQETTGATIKPDAVVEVSPYTHQGGYSCGTGATAGQCTPGQLGGDYSYYNQTTINNYGCSNVDGNYTCTQGPGCGPGTQVSNGQCVGTPNCGSGTHNQNGICVPDGCTDDPQTPEDECGPGDGDDGGDCTDDPETEVDECEGEGSGGSCPEGSDCGFAAPKQGSGFVDGRGEVSAAQGALTQRYAEIRGELSSIVRTVSTGGGSLPCTSFNLWGRSIPFCLTPYQQALSIIASALLAICYFIAAMIIMKAD